jgi:ABC-2 type transport system permease protein
MKGALTIAGKDLRGTFFSPLFYIVSGLCTVAWTLMYIFKVSDFRTQSFVQMRQTGGQGEGLNLHYAVFAPHISLVNLFMIFAVSALTMRLFTEEKRARTYDLLLTSPVTATEIMLGKLIAGTLTAWALLLISFLYPLSLGIFAALDWGPLLASYFGLMMLVMTYAAIGMFASSLTESSVLAVLMALIFNVMLWFIGAAGDSVESPVWQSVFEHLNVSQHFIGFMKGTLSISSFTFFASLIFLASFLTQRVVESTRWR